MGIRITPAELRLAAVYRRQLFVFSRQQALEAGCPPRLIERRVASGLWVPRFRAVYATWDAEVTPQHLALAAVLAVGAPAAAWGMTAAALWHFEDARFPDVPQVVTAAPRHLRPRGVDLRRSRTLEPSDIVVRRCVPVTRPERMMIDLASILAPDRLEDTLDAVIRAGGLTPRRLLARIERCPRYGVPGLGTLRSFVLRRVGRRVSGSSPENRMRRLLVRRGLPEPVAQYVVRDAKGRFLGEVDHAYPERKIAIEYDSFAEHSGRRRYARTVRRKERLEDAGWKVASVTSEDLDEYADELVARIARWYEERTPLCGA